MDMVCYTMPMDLTTRVSGGEAEGMAEVTGIIGYE